MSPRTLKARIRAIVDGYKAGGGELPVIEIEGDRITVRERGQRETEKEEGDSLQRRIEEAMGAGNG